MSWRRILLLSIAFLIALGATTWIWLQNSGAMTQLVARQLQGLLVAQAGVDSTHIDLGAGRLSVRGLRIMDPTRADRALLAVETADLDVVPDPFDDLAGLRSVTIDGLEVDLGPTLPAPDQLVRGSGGSGSSLERLPHVLLQRGRIRFALRDGVPPLELRELTVQLTPVPGSPQRSEITGTGRLLDLDTTLHLRGSVDIATGAMHFAASVRDVPLDTAVRDRLQQLLELQLEDFDASARIRELTVACTVPDLAAADRTPVFEVAAQLDGVAVEGRDLPRLVHGATVSLHATSLDGGAITAHAIQESDAGRFDVKARATSLSGEPDIEIRAAARNIRIDHEVISALRTFDVGNDVVEALRPTKGAADLDLFLHNPHRRGSEEELELVLRDVAMAYYGFGDPATRASFPLPLVGARGRVRLRDDVVLLEDVTAAIAPQAGGGTVRLVGRVDTDRPAGEETSIDLHAEGVAFNEHLRAALSALLHDDGVLYDRFAPGGRTEVSLQVRPQQQLAGGWSVEVRPTAATMKWAGFPYQLDELRGSVLVRADGAGFDLAGVHGGGALSMRGRIPIDPNFEPTEPGFEAVIELRRVPLDGDLRAAVAVLAPEIEEPWSKAQPRGHLAGHVKVWRPRPGDPLYHDVQMDLEGVDLDLPAAPWRAVDLRGRMFVQGQDGQTRIDFDALRGRLEHGSGPPAKLAMLGALTTGAQTSSDLAFVVRDLELDEQLGRTLEELGAQGPGTWDTLRPSGTIDLVCRHELPAADEGEQRLRLIVQLVHVRSESPILPRPADKMTGELAIADGELRFRDVRAEIGGALVQCTDGVVRTLPLPDGRTELAFRVQANGVPVDDGLANLFAGPLHQAVLDRDLTGRADVDGLGLRFLIPMPGSTLPFETQIGGQLRLYDVEMSLGQGDTGIRVRGINGVISLADSVVSETGGGLAGAMRGGTMEVVGQPFEAIEATFAADATRIEFGSLTSRFQGGAVANSRVDAPALHFLLPAPGLPQGRLSANLVFERVDVYSFLLACGWQSPPYSGTARGDFQLHRLDGSDVIDALANGRLVVERGDLGVVPLFTAIYAQLPAPDRPRFHQLDVDFRLADREVTFDRLKVDSNLLAIDGKGSLQLDGYLDIEMRLDSLLGTSADPVVMPLIDFLQQQIVRFHLFGFLRDLSTQQRWATQRSPRRRPVVPMPPEVARSPLPEY